MQSIKSCKKEVGASVRCEVSASPVSWWTAAHISAVAMKPLRAHQIFSIIFRYIEHNAAGRIHVFSIQYVRIE